MSDSANPATPPGVAKQWPNPMSTAFSTFLNEHIQIAQLHLLVVMLAYDKDQRHLAAAKAISELDEIDTAKKPDAIKAVMQGYGTWKAFMSVEPIFSQMVHVRAVGNYLIYLSDLWSLIFSVRPETMRSDAQVKLSDVLSHKTMDEFIAAQIERRVLDLAFKGVRKLADEISKRLGFELFEDPADLDRAARIIDVRNLVVHNRGIVNRLFLEHQPTSSQSLGDAVLLDSERVFEDVAFVAASAADIEVRAAKKFGLPQPISSEESEIKTSGLARIMGMLERQLPLKDPADQFDGGSGA